MAPSLAHQRLGLVDRERDAKREGKEGWRGGDGGGTRVHFSGLFPSRWETFVRAEQPAAGGATRLSSQVVALLESGLISDVDYFAI